MYQRALTNVEKVLKPSVARVMNAGTVAAFDAGRQQLAAAVVIVRSELAKITPPSGLVTAHPAVLDAFDAYAGNVATELTKAGDTGRAVDSRSRPSYGCTRRRPGSGPRTPSSRRAYRRRSARA